MSLTNPSFISKIFKLEYSGKGGGGGGNYDHEKEMLATNCFYKKTKQKSHSTIPRSYHTELQEKQLKTRNKTPKICLIVPKLFPN